MDGRELLKRLRRVGKANGIAVRYDGKPGKGSHGRVFYGTAFTTIKVRIAYPARFEAEEGGRVLVTFRDLPEAATDGADLDEARSEAADLLDSALMFRMKHREEIPTPSRRRKDEEDVAPDAAVALKVALYIAMRRQGMTVAELSRRLGVDYREAQRILNPHHATRTARMAEAIEATGNTAVIELRAAAAR